MITNSTIGKRGRLGNQLYQVAMLMGVRAVTGYEIAIPRPYTASDVPLMDGTNALAGFRIDAPTLNLGAFSPAYRFAEGAGHDYFMPAVFDQPDDTEYYGWFQSWRYFDHIKDEIRKQYGFRDDIQIQAADTCWRLPRPRVSINIRRGDYLQRPYDSFFIQLNAKYYHEAIRQFPPDTHFVVVSDDMEWCRFNFRGQHFTFINTGNYWVDMCCITQCDHHIIANSSFAWWAAWLNSRQGKRVIVPSAWYKPDRHLKWNDADHNPPEWERLEVMED